MSAITDAILKAYDSDGNTASFNNSEANSYLINQYGLTKNEANVLIKKFDTSGDGALDQTEFATMQAEIAKDHNGDGKITGADVKKLAQSLLFEITGDGDYVAGSAPPAEVSGSDPVEEEEEDESYDYWYGGS